MNNLRLYVRLSGAFYAFSKIFSKLFFPMATVSIENVKIRQLHFDPELRLYSTEDLGSNNTFDDCFIRIEDY